MSVCIQALRNDCERLPRIASIASFATLSRLFRTTRIRNRCDKIGSVMRIQPAVTDRPVDMLNSSTNRVARRIKHWTKPRFGRCGKLQGLRVNYGEDWYFRRFEVFLNFNGGFSVGIFSFCKADSSFIPVDARHCCWPGGCDVVLLLNSCRGSSVLLRWLIWKFVCRGSHVVQSVLSHFVEREL